MIEPFVFLIIIILSVLSCRLHALINQVENLESRAERLESKVVELSRTVYDLQTNWPRRAQ